MASQLDDIATKFEFTYKMANHFKSADTTLREWCFLLQSLRPRPVEETVLEVDWSAITAKTINETGYCFGYNAQIPFIQVDAIQGENNESNTGLSVKLKNLI